MQKTTALTNLPASGKVVSGEISGMWPKGNESGPLEFRSSIHPAGCVGPWWRRRWWCFKFGEHHARLSAGGALVPVGSKLEL